MAVVKIAGKQFLVEEGQTITVPRLDLEVGKTLKAKDMLSEKEMTFEVVEQKRGKKILVVKFRNKTRYKRVIGSKANLTVVKSVKAAEKKVNEVKEVEKSKPAAKKSTKKEG